MTQERTQWLVWTGFLTFMVVIQLAFGGVWSQFRTLTGESIEQVGEVVGGRHSRCGTEGGCTDWADVQFVTNDGSTVVATVQVSENDRVGSAVRVTYRPADPSAAIASSGNAVIFAGFTAIMLVAAVVTAFLALFNAPTSRSGTQPDTPRDGS